MNTSSVARQALWLALFRLLLLRTDLRAPVDPSVMASDASLSGGAVCRSTDLTSRNLFASQFAARQHTSCIDGEVALICFGDELGAARCRWVSQLSPETVANPRRNVLAWCNRIGRRRWTVAPGSANSTREPPLCAVCVVLVAGKLAGSAGPTEDSSTVLQAAPRQFRSSWQTVRFFFFLHTRKPT